MNDATSECADLERLSILARVGTWVEKQWLLDELLGVGGMAAVYSATHRSGRRAAFKILHRRHRDDADVVARFRAERRIATAIRHTACVRIVGESVADDGAPLLVLELLHGRTLQDAWNSLGWIDLAEALRIGESLLDFLVASHAVGIVHRDLKPSNVFLAAQPQLDDASMPPPPEVKVIDFGVAMQMSRRRTNRRVCIGTPSFMAPEQARGASMDGRADLFAIGAILYGIISGVSLRRPRELAASGAPERARSLLRDAPGLCEGVASIIEKALAHDRQDRFTDARAMRDALREVRESADLRWTPSAETRQARDSVELDTLPETPQTMRRTLDDTVATRPAVDTTPSVSLETSS